MAVPIGAILGALMSSQGGGGGGGGPAPTTFADPATFMQPTMQGNAGNPVMGPSGAIFTGGTLGQPPKRDKTAELLSLIINSLQPFKETIGGLMSALKGQGGGQPGGQNPNEGPPVIPSGGEGSGVLQEQFQRRPGQSTDFRASPGQGGFGALR